jgi:predicted glutamine amidotransferase
MCRLLGIVASESTEFALVLRDAPRSLASLSHQHPDGWGIAIHDKEAHHAHGARWHLHKGTERAAADPSFHALAGRSRGHVLVAHIRQKTVGATKIENTHPFARDGWVFAHNGTIPCCKALREATTPERLQEISGETDSEVLFAYLLSRLDRAGLTHLEDEASRREATHLVASAASELRCKDIGAFNFLLSDGRTCFAHRYKRTLFVLERGPEDEVRSRRQVTEATTLVTRWTSRRRAVFVASERITDEPWREVEEGSLLRIDREPDPHIVPSEQHRVAS